MKKMCKKVNGKKNNVDVKEKIEMRKINELEGFMLANMFDDADELRLIVQKNMFDNMVVLFENEGYDMSFMDSINGVEMKKTAVDLENKFEQGGDFDENSLETLYIIFISYLEFGETTNKYVEYINSQTTEMRVGNFLTKYFFCMRMNFYDRQNFISFLCEKAQEYKDNGNTVAYDRTANYLSMLLFNESSVELYRSLGKIVENFVNEKFA